MTPVSISAILRHLESAAALRPEEREYLSHVLTTSAATEHRAKTEIFGSGSVSAPCFIVSGWTCSAVRLGNGRRQILDFNIPGDLIGYSSRDARTRGGQVCLMDAVTLDASALITGVRERPDRYPGLTKALASIEDETDQRLVNQVVRLGRLGGNERLGSLIAELTQRCRRAGLGTGKEFVIPLTQETFGDALGLSTVHVNRVLQELRRARVIRTLAGRIEVLGEEPSNGRVRVGVE